jgi:hypothetical protein
MSVHLDLVFTEDSLSIKEGWGLEGFQNRKNSSIYKKRLVSRINPSLLPQINLQNT